MSEDLSWLAELSPAERAEWDRLVAARPQWTPLPGPQDAAYRTGADILLYGGAAGGGKTDLLLGVARREHARAVIFRRIFPSLRGIIDRSREIYNPGRNDALKDSYNESLHRWRFPDGRTIRFGSLQFETNKTDWQGQAHDLYGFDEITEFTETQFRYVIAWNRTTKPNQRCRVICTGNPPTTAEGEWVIRFWGPWLDETHPKPARPGELRWFTTGPDGKDMECAGPEPVMVGGRPSYPRSRTFIPAKVEDNPFLLRTGYVANLQSLPEPLRSKMLYGDFRAGREDDARQVIPSAWVRAAQARWKPEPPMPMTALGCDVARGGKDRSAAAPRHGWWFGPIQTQPGSATPDGPRAAAFFTSCVQAKAVIKIDVIGVGNSPYDLLKGQEGLEGRVVAMNGGRKSGKRDKSKQLGFYNKRAEWYWKLREALDPTSGMDLALPPDPELRADLCAPTWELTPRGIKVEEKDEIIKRIGRSPDKGDAIVYAHAEESDLAFMEAMGAL